MRRTFWLLVGAAAATINVSLVALFGWTAFNPRGIYGPVKESINYVALVVALFPLANLIALYARGTGMSNRRRYVAIIRALNVGAVGLAFLFGVASCAELTFSRIEQVVTLFLLVPPAATAAALRWPTTTTLEGTS